MATGIAWLLNLDAERELRDPAHYAPDPAIEARIAPLRARMTMLLGPGDRVIGHDPDLSGCARALAFCPTPSALARIARAGFSPPPAPTLAVLAAVNRRAFCAALGQTLPGARYVRNMEELNAAIAPHSPHETWLLKRDFGFAGRERQLVRGGVLDRPTLGFARRSFARQEGLQLEPWLARTADFAQHGYVFRDGRHLLGTPMSQRCDPRGSWIESAPLTVELPDGERTALEASARAAGEALAHAGYFGPFGVDAFRYLDRPGGAAYFQPRSELNARFSMGYPRALLERALAVEGYHRA